jgi:hypothetical protein
MAAIVTSKSAPINRKPNLTPFPSDNNEVSERTDPVKGPGDKEPRTCRCSRALAALDRHPGLLPHSLQTREGLPQGIAFRRVCTGRESLRRGRVRRRLRLVRAPWLGLIVDVGGDRTERGGAPRGQSAVGVVDQRREQRKGFRPGQKGRGGG